MADFYRLGIGQFNGTGTVTVNSQVVSTGGQGGSIDIEEGTTVNVEVDLDEGFVSFSALVEGGPFTTSPFSFTMPSRDLLMRVNFSGEFNPIDGYGLKYFWDYKSLGNEDRRLEIYEDGFGGIAEENQIKNLFYTWGNLGDDILNPLIGSKIEFELLASFDKFNEFLTGDNRKFKALYYHGSDVVFEGYVNTDRLTVPENTENYFIKFEAVDGVRGFESTRFISQRTPSNRNLAIGNIIGALNQTFVDGRNVNICAEIFEDRMDSDNCLFEEFQFVYSAIYEDGEVAKFTDGTRIVNEKLYISEVIKRFINPFLCRCFLYKNEWYIVRLDDYRKDSLRFFSFAPDGSRIGVDTIDNTDQIFDCLDYKFAGNVGSRAIRDSGLIYNEFTSILRLGVLDQSVRGGIYETKFTRDDWFLTGAFAPVPNLYRLSNWQYIRAIPFDGVSSTVNPAVMAIQYVSEGGSEYALFWFCTNSLGLNDPNISWIELMRNANFSSIPVLQETANTISINLEYIVNPVNDSITLVPVAHDVAIMIKIADNWLDYDSSTQTFSWVGTENIMSFRVRNIRDWNVISINQVVVPEDGFLEVKIYQLINNGQAQRNYHVGFRNFKFDIEQTEGLSSSEIAFKSETTQPYNRVHPDYVTHIGDAITSNSLSAIKLLDDSVSETWTDDLNTSQPLQAIQVQNLANLKGRRNLRVTGKVYRNQFPNVAKTVNYDGLKWMVNYFKEDSHRNEVEIQMIEIQ